MVPRYPRISDRARDAVRGDDYEGDRSCASLPKLSVGEGVVRLAGDSDEPTGVEDLGATGVV